MSKWVNFIFHVCMFFAGFLFVLVVSRESGIIYRNAKSILRQEQESLQKLETDLEGVKRDFTVVSKEKTKFTELEKKAVFSSLNRVEAKDLLKKEASSHGIRNLKLTIQPDQTTEVLGLKRRSTPIHIGFEAQTDREVWLFINSLKERIPGIMQIVYAKVKRGNDVSVSGELHFTITKLKVAKS